MKRQGGNGRNVSRRWMFDDFEFVNLARRFMDVPGGFPYGFIECEETKLRFSRVTRLQRRQPLWRSLQQLLHPSSLPQDVYVHRKQMEGLQIGWCPQRIHNSCHWTACILHHLTWHGCSSAVVVRCLFLCSDFGRNCLYLPALIGRCFWNKTPISWTFLTCKYHVMSTWNVLNDSCMKFFTGMWTSQCLSYG